MIRSPKTYHVGDSKGTPRDNQPWSVLEGRHLAVEEKVDGSEASIYFTDDLELIIASRGERVPRIGHYKDLWLWAALNTDALFDVLTDRYVMFGQWARLKHTIFYDALPFIPFLEEDIYDKQEGAWLDTISRRKLLAPMKSLSSVPVLFMGTPTPTQIPELPSRFLMRSLFQTKVAQGRFVEQAQQLRMDSTTLNNETDHTEQAEGLYIKVEAQGVVVSRFKWVRREFLQTILNSKGHWKARRGFPNLTREP